MLCGLYPVGICIYFHTAELVTIKLPAVQPVPFLAEAKRLAGDDAVIVAAGSLYFAGSLRTALGLAWR